VVAVYQEILQSSNPNKYIEKCTQIKKYVKKNQLPEGTYTTSGGKAFTELAATLWWTKKHGMTML
jgi:hypothetical protein